MRAMFWHLIDIGALELANDWTVKLGEHEASVHIGSPALTAEDVTRLREYRHLNPVCGCLWCKLLRGYDAASARVASLEEACDQLVRLAGPGCATAEAVKIVAALRGAGEVSEWVG